MAKVLSHLSSFIRVGPIPYNTPLRTAVKVSGQMYIVQFIVYTDTKNFVDPSQTLFWRKVHNILL